MEIDAGNSKLEENDALELVDLIKKYTHKDEYCTNYEARTKYLNNISRATFDNLVRDGKLPKGEKLYAGDNTLFWKVTELLKYRDKNKKGS